MLRHAFETLGLHRVALSVFEFNERAIRAYRRVGFTTEGRAREAIRRDGRWWDELSMSILEEDWRAFQRRSRPSASRATVMADGAPVREHREPARVGE
jgi:ribosomal protein S18 acetylase RimI-like enzyme